MKAPVLEIKDFNVDYGLGEQSVQAVRDVTASDMLTPSLASAGGQVIRIVPAKGVRD